MGMNLFLRKCRCCRSVIDLSKDMKIGWIDGDF